MGSTSGRAALFGKEKQPSTPEAFPPCSSEFTLERRDALARSGAVTQFTVRAGWIHQGSGVTASHKTEVGRWSVWRHDDCGQRTCEYRQIASGDTG